MLQLLKKRRSIRKYQNRRVEKDLIYQIIEAALLSPSSKDNNPWKFILIDNHEILTELSKAKKHGSEFLARAPLAILLLADPVESDVWIEDCSIAATIIMLMAQSLGLSSCWVQFRNRSDYTGLDSGEYIKKLLEIPEDMCILCAIGMGYQDEHKAEKVFPEKELNDVFLNVYGQKYNF